MDGLQYTLIARGTFVLLESGVENAGGFDSVARRLPAQLSLMEPGTKKTFSHEGKCFHCLVSSPDMASQRTGDDSVIVIIVLATGFFSATRSFMFLTDVCQKFKDYDPPTSAETFRPDYSGFDFQVRERMHFYSTDRSIEKVRDAQRQVDETKKIMMDNIDLSINRGEKIEILAGKLDDMNASSQSFLVQAKKTKRAFCCQNARRCCFIFSVFAVLALILLGVGIYFLIKWAPWKHHHHDDDDDSDSFGSSYSGFVW